MLAFLLIALVLLAGLIGFLFVPAYLGRRRLEFRAQILTLLAIAARRGVPFAPLLQRAAQEQDGVKREALSGAAARLTAGEPLSQALLAVQHWFPERHFAAIKSSEGTSHLPALLGSLANDTTVALSARHRLYMTMFYPICLGLFLIGMQSVFVDFAGVTNEALDAAPGSGMTLTHLITGGVALTWLVLALLMVYRLCGWRWRPLQRLADLLVRKVPLLDQLARLAAGERLLRSTAALVGAGLSLPLALRKAAPATGGGRSIEAALASADLMDSGATADQAWTRTLLPPFAALRAATATASAPAELSSALAALANECGHRFAGHVDRVLRWVQPATIALFGGLLGLQFAGVFSMIYKFHQEASLW